MVGKYDIEVYNNKAHYFLTIKRNITILQGDSASGKSELIRLIGEYEANGNSSGITVKCDKKCTVLTNVDWELRLSSLKQSIIFIDETAAFLKDKKFAEMVRGADNFFVIVSRDNLVQLPYSVEEIYGLRNVSDSSKYTKKCTMRCTSYIIVKRLGRCSSVRINKEIICEKRRGFWQYVRDSGTWKSRKEIFRNKTQCGL